MAKKYRSRRRGESAPILEMEIVLKPSRAYEIRHFSMLALRALVEYHSKVHLPRKWTLSKDEKRLTLE